MTNKQILKKAIKRVEKNGFKLKQWYLDICEIKNIEDGWKHFIYSHKFMWVALIFSHDFAKAFWGKKLSHKKCDHEIGHCMAQAYGWKAYQHRMLDYLQEGKEPLKYLEKFLK